jgi:hypothetical protein
MTRVPMDWKARTMFGHVGAVGLADGRFVSSVVMIVHAVASRGHGRLKAENVVGHAMEKAGGLLAAPTVLPGADVQLRQAPR